MGDMSVLKSDHSWRLSELAIIKSLPLRYNLKLHHKNTLIKYSVPSIYAIWEGFVKVAFEFYINHINEQEISYKEIHPKILAHAINSVDKLNLNNARINFNSQLEHTNHYINYISNPLKIECKLPTKSNIDFKVINDILNRFALSPIPNKFELDLKKLLFFRNSVAHGDNSINVTYQDINRFTLLVGELIAEIILRIENGLKTQNYRK